MKSSDLVSRHVRQPAMDSAEILKLVLKNDKRAHAQVDWKGTHINLTRGAVESQRYGRDAAVAAYDERKELHEVLDQTMAGGGYTKDRAEVRTLHRMLDEALDMEEKKHALSRSESESEEPSAADSESDEEEEIAPAAAARDSGNRCYAQDGGNLSTKEYERQERATRMKNARPI